MPLNADEIVVPRRGWMDRVDAMLAEFEGSRASRSPGSAAGDRQRSGPQVLVTLYEAGSANGLYKAKEIARNAAGTAWQVVAGGLVFDGAAGNLPQVREILDRVGLAKADPNFSPALLELQERADGTLEWVFSSGAPALQWARVVSVSNNNITATPVADSAGTPITPTPANITIVAHIPGGRTPIVLTGTPVIPYVSDGTSHVAINIPEVPGGGSLGHCLQPGSGAGSGGLLWDYVRVG